MPVLVGMRGAIVLRGAAARASARKRRHGALAIEPRHSLDVVIEHVGRAEHHGFQRGPVAAKIRNQNFDLQPGTRSRIAVMVRAKIADAAVGLIVAIHRGHHRIPQAHALDGARHAFGLVLIGRSDRLARRHRAEPARARADIAQDHEGGRAMLPALAHVRAARALADGVQIERAHDALQSPDNYRRQRSARAATAGADAIQAAAKAYNRWAREGSVCEPRKRGVTS
jgi:hypothetical protein